MKKYDLQILLGFVMFGIIGLIHLLSVITDMYHPLINNFAYLVVLFIGLNDLYKQNLKVGKTCCLWNFKSTLIAGFICSFFLLVSTLVFAGISGGSADVISASFLPAPNLKVFLLFILVKILLSTLIISFFLFIYWKDYRHDYFKGFLNKEKFSRFSEQGWNGPIKWDESNIQFPSSQD